MTPDRAFLFVVVAAPIRKVRSRLRGLMDEQIPLIVEPQDQQDTARCIETVLVEHGYPLQRREPSWAMKAPGAILRTVGGGAFRHFVPQQIELLRAPGLEVIFNPTGVTLRGKDTTTAKAHGLIAEAMTGTKALQSMDPKAQVIEKQIKDVWKVFESRPQDHASSPILLKRLAEITREISSLTVSYEEWQIVYRQALQLSRALHGQGQLLEKHTTKEDTMTLEDPRPGADTAPASAPADSEALRKVPLKDLLSDIADRVKLLASKEVELAKAEIKADLHAEIGMAKSLAVAAVCAILGLNMLLVAAAFALANVVPEWAAALILAAPFLILAIVMGAVAKTKRVKRPLEATRASLKEDFEWTKNRLA
ncbi:MAG: phage holin family protein [Thermoanaerobaculia bacterium]